MLFKKKKNLDIVQNFVKSCYLTDIGLFAYGAWVPDKGAQFPQIGCILRKCLKHP